MCSWGSVAIGACLMVGIWDDGGVYGSMLSAGFLWEDCAVDCLRLNLRYVVCAG